MRRPVVHRLRSYTKAVGRPSSTLISFSAEPICQKHENYAEPHCKKEECGHDAIPTVAAAT